MRDHTVREDSGAGLKVMMSIPWPVAYTAVEFELPLREIASFQEMGLPMTLRPAANAAIALARTEDDLIFNGSRETGVDGLLTVKGSQSVEGFDWNTIGDAANTIIAAITKLDGAGLHGPYTLALAPGLYNLLLRRYPQGEMTELQHLSVMVTSGIVKSPAIASGGVLMAYGKEFASIVLGQDIMTGFIGPESTGFRFVISESVFLRIVFPEAICVLRP
jgi:uncharacterized linocin/CFP29 family protein